MNKKNTIKKTTALLLGLGFALAGTGCGFITTDNDADVKQTVAEVNITDYLENDQNISYGDFADDLETVLKTGRLNTKILKRDLISYFLNVGYNYVNNYGYSYKDTFNMLIDSLVSRKIISQYALAYYLAKEGSTLTADGCVAYIASEKTKDGLSDKEKALLSAHPEISALKYFLTENGADQKAYDEVVYSLQKSINDSLDSMEQTIIAKEDETHDHGEKRTTPTGISTLDEDYLPAQYAIYTGHNTPDSCGEYERVNGSTAYTRKKAYGQLLSSLQQNGLIKKGEDATDFTLLDYYYVELAAQLEQAIITKYTESLDDQSFASLTGDYVADKYEEILASQKKSHQKDPQAFEKALENVSDTSFVLYNPTSTVEKANYGFVYNILLPFSEVQNQQINEVKNRNLTKSEIYAYREDILTQVQGKDLRDSWFCEHEDENFAFQKNDKWYFFEDNFGEGNTGKYDSLNHYLGNYAYNGTVSVDEKTGKYTCTPNKMDIKAFIPMMEKYIADESGATVSGSYYTNYVTNGNYTLNESKEFADYSEFMYYVGKADVGAVSADEYFNATGANANQKAYKATSAFNELMFAYSTDTGCLNTYMGYVVSPYKTSYVPEFEYAAQYAVKQGAGTYVVCPSDYGWHIIYVTYVFEEGDVYAGYNHAERETEGTFSYLFYEALKSKVTSSTTIVQNGILSDYNNDTCVTLYKDAYKDLLEIQ